jgi:hypothetical protein
VTTIMQPPDGTHASGYARVRVSDADRERAIDVLKDAFAEGRLTGDEHAERVERAHGSRTDAELAAVSGDLPAGPPGTPPSQARPGPAGYLLRPAARTNPLAIASLTCGLIPVLPATIAAIVWESRPATRSGRPASGVPGWPWPGSPWERCTSC